MQCANHALWRFHLFFPSMHSCHHLELVQGAICWTRAVWCTLTKCQWVVGKLAACCKTATISYESYKTIRAINKNGVNWVRTMACTISERQFFNCSWALNLKIQNRGSLVSMEHSPPNKFLAANQLKASLKTAQQSRQTSLYPERISKGQTVKTTNRQPKPIPPHSAPGE